MIRPIRVKPSTRFIKSCDKIGEPVASRAKKAVAKFLASPEARGLNFEAVKGAQGFFTIRVNRNFRILLKEEADEEGSYYLLIEVASHDHTYEEF